MKITTEDIHSLDFQYYMEAVLKQYKYQEGFAEATYYFSTDLCEPSDKPLFDSSKHQELYPEIGKYQKMMLEAIEELPKDKLINIINTLIIENYQIVEQYERPDRHSTDTTSVSDTQL